MVTDGGSQSSSSIRQLSGNGVVTDGGSPEMLGTYCTGFITEEFSVPLDLT